MKRTQTLTYCVLPALLIAASVHAQQLAVPKGRDYRGKKITAKTFNSGFALGHDSYNAMGEAKGLEDLHLVTYDIEKLKYIDSGAVFYENGERPLYVNAITIGKDGMVYTLPRITECGKTRSDLVSFKAD